MKRSISLLVLLTTTLGLFFVCTLSIRAESVRTPKGDFPKVHWALLDSIPGHMSEMQALARDHVAPEVANEPGTYALYGGGDRDDSNSMLLLEIYQDEPSYEKHVGSAGFHEYKTRRAPILAKLEIVDSKPVALERKRAGEGNYLVAETLVVPEDKREKTRALLESESRRFSETEDSILGAFATEDRNEPGVFRTLVIATNETDARVANETKKRSEYRDALEALGVEIKARVEIDAPVVLTERGLAREK